MASRSSKQLGQTKKVKPSGNAKFIKDWVFNPESPSDYAWLAAGPATRVIGGITKKGAKFVNKVYRNMGK